MTTELPEHLGGHGNISNDDVGALQLIILRLGVRSLVDIGCGTGNMVRWAIDHGLTAVGVDGDFTLKWDVPVVVNDYTKGPAVLPVSKYDLAYSVEFLEHVDAIFMPNYMDTFKRCRYALVTHAVPGQCGHHHVNCQDDGYWILQFQAAGFEPDWEITKAVRAASTMHENYMRDTGLFFRAKGAA